MIVRRVKEVNGNRRTKNAENIIIVKGSNRGYEQVKLVWRVEKVRKGNGRAIFWQKIE